MSSGDMLRIASMTKTFVAAVVLKLAEEGKLDLNETVSRYVPDITARIANGQSATVRNLLNMTSGMFEYYDNPAYLSAVETRPARQAWTAEEVIAYAYDQSAYFSPGVNFKYTNTNYLLLELIVNRVSASTLAAEMTDPVHAAGDGQYVHGNEGDQVRWIRRAVGPRIQYESDAVQRHHRAE